MPKFVHEGPIKGCNPEDSWGLEQLNNDVSSESSSRWRLAWCFISNSMKFQMWLKCPDVYKYNLLRLFIYNQHKRSSNVGCRFWICHVKIFFLVDWFVSEALHRSRRSVWHESVWRSRGIREQPVQLNTSRTLVISQICRRPTNHLLVITLGLIAHACLSDREHAC